MTETQAQELLELTRRMAAAIEKLARAGAPRDRRLHPKLFVARTLGLNKNRLADYILAGVIRTTKSGRHDRIPDEELQRVLRDGLPELGPRRRSPAEAVRPVTCSPRPAPKSTSEKKPGASIRALRIP